MSTDVVVIGDTGRVTIRKALGIASQVAFTVTYSDGSKAQLVGTSYGMPGPVTLLMEGWVSQQRVTEPERFGAKFDVEWVKNFVLNREAQAALDEVTTNG